MKALLPPANAGSVSVGANFPRLKAGAGDLTPPDGGLGSWGRIWKLNLTKIEGTLGKLIFQMRPQLTSLGLASVAAASPRLKAGAADLTPPEGGAEPTVKGQSAAAGGERSPAPAFRRGLRSPLRVRALVTGDRLHVQRWCACREVGGTQAMLAPLVWRGLAVRALGGGRARAASPRHTRGRALTLRQQTAAAGLKRNRIAGAALHAERRNACDGADEFLGREGFLHVVVESGREGQLALEGTAVRGQGNGGNP